MRLVAQMKAKEEALSSIHELRDEQNMDETAENIWFIFGTKHFESKVKDMLKNAKKSIFCITSGQYLDLIERKAKSNIRFDLTIISEDSAIQRRLEGIQEGYVAGPHPKQEPHGKIAPVRESEAR